MLAGTGFHPPQWAGLKFFNVYGPNEQHKDGQRSVVVQLYEQIRATGTARLFRSHNPDYADGGQLRDFIWVGDCVDVMLWLYDTPSVSGIFNCGTGVARSFLDLANACFAAMEREPSIEFIDTPETIRDKYQYFTEATTARLRRAGYERPFTPLEEGVARYIRQYLATNDPRR
jgi:ADP-L-glycero-D-manno-heptose 6-epimerase